MKRTPSHVTGLDVILLNSIPEPNSGCWIWEKCLKANGYGLMKRSTYGEAYAHRYAWRSTNNWSVIPTNMVIMHKCDNRACVNPDHLTIGTHKDNTQDSIRKGRFYRHPSYAHTQDSPAVMIR